MRDRSKVLEQRAGVLDDQGHWILPPAVLQKAYTEANLTLAPGEGRIWALAPHGGTLGIIVNLWTPESGLTGIAGADSLRSLPVEGANLKRLTEIALLGGGAGGGYVVGWSASKAGLRYAIGVTALDPHMTTARSVEIAPAFGTVYSVAVGPELLPLAWRDDTNLSGPVQMDLLTHDLAAVRRLRVPARPDATTEVLMLWRDGGFDVVWGMFAAGRMGYGRITASEDVLWAPSFLGDASQRNEVKSLVADGRGRTWLLYTRDTMIKVNPETVIGRLVFAPDGPPVFEEVWVTESDYFTSRLALMGDDLVVLAPQSQETFLAFLSCPE